MKWFKRKEKEDVSMTIYICTKCDRCFVEDPDDSENLVPLDTSTVCIFRYTYLIPIEFVCNKCLKKLVSEFKSLKTKEESDDDREETADIRKKLKLKGELK